MRESSIKHYVVLHARRTGRSLNVMGLRAWSMSMSRLADRWHRKLEAEAAACEHRFRRQIAAAAGGPGSHIPQVDAGSGIKRMESIGSNRTFLVPALNYRSSLKRSILVQLTRKPQASDLEICRALDEDGAEELPPSWRTKENARSFVAAYRNSHARRKVEISISKIRSDLRKRGVLGPG